MLKCKLYTLAKAKFIHPFLWKLYWEEKSSKEFKKSDRKQLLIFLNNKKVFYAEENHDVLVI